MRNTLLKVLMALTVFFLTSCFKKDDYDHVDAARLITFEPNVQSVVADGSSSAAITITVNSQVISSKRSVVLKTTLGSFVSGVGDSIVVKADQDLKVTASLISTKAGQADITASISGNVIKTNQPVTFLQAYPVKISAKVDSISIRNNYKSELVITASLKSENGVPSQGQPVIFSAYSPSGRPTGVFLNGLNTSGTDGKGIATIRYSAGPTTELGKFSLVTTTQKEDKTILRDTTYIYLTN